MMLNFLRKILFLISTWLLASNPVLAGEKGFSVVMVNIGRENFYDSTVYKEFSMRFNNGALDSCWNAMHLADGESGLDFITKKNLPPGMTNELGLNIWNGDLQAINKARNVMMLDSESKKATPSHEFHGLYIIKPEGHHLSLMGVGINKGKGSHTGVSQKLEGILLDPNNPQKAATAFERALCKVSKPFNIGFGV